MGLCRHPNVLAVFGVLIHQDPFKDVALVMEIAQHRTLFQFLHVAEPQFASYHFMF